MNNDSACVNISRECGSCSLPCSPSLQHVSRTEEINRELVFLPSHQLDLWGIQGDLRSTLLPLPDVSFDRGSCRHLQKRLLVAKNAHCAWTLKTLHTCNPSSCLEWMVKCTIQQGKEVLRWNGEKLTFIVITLPFARHPRYIPVRRLWSNKTYKLHYCRRRCLARSLGKARLHKQPRFQGHPRLPHKPFRRPGYRGNKMAAAVQGLCCDVLPSLTLFSSIALCWIIHLWFQLCRRHT